MAEFGNFLALKSQLEYALPMLSVWRGSVMFTSVLLEVRCLSKSSVAYSSMAAMDCFGVSLVYAHGWSSLVMDSENQCTSCLSGLDLVEYHPPTVASVSFAPASVAAVMSVSATGGIGDLGGELINSSITSASMVISLGGLP